MLVASSIHDPLPVAGDILTKAAAVLPSEGVPSVLALGIHLTPLLRALVQIAGGVAQAALPNADTVLVLRAVPMGQLTVEATLPMQTMAQSSATRDPAAAREVMALGRHGKAGAPAASAAFSGVRGGYRFPRLRPPL